ncbi:MAG: hypothetical protein IJ662_09220 [Clostridia bacterium]|nr:hypothetical protein [Clostridia bacterium]
MLNRQEDWQKVFGQPSAAFDARIQRTLNQLEEEKPMKRITVRTVVLALALLLALTGVVYAATNGWTVADYFNNRFGDNVNAPKDFDSGFAGDFTQELDDLTFRIRDAVVENGTLNAIVEISRTDGKPALFRGEDCMEEDPICNLYIGMPDEGEGLKPVGQYAQEKGLPLYWVETGFLQEGEVVTGGGDYWMEADDKQMGYFVFAEDVRAEGGLVSLQWTVYVHDPNGELHRQAMDITLPANELERRAIPVDRQVEGLPVILDEVTLSKGSMGLYIDFVWHIEEALGMEETATALRQNDLNLWFRCVDPESGKELPGGPSLNGSMGSQDDVHFTQIGDSISADFDGDALYIQPYDAWEKTTYGLIEVKIR